MTASGGDFAMLFGQNLRRARRRVDLSQEELSFRASLHQTEVSQLERGLRVARADTVVKLAGALAVPIESLFEGIVWRPGRLQSGAFEVSERD